MNQPKKEYNGVVHFWLFYMFGKWCIKKLKMKKGPAAGLQVLLNYTSLILELFFPSDSLSEQFMNTM